MDIVSDHRKPWVLVVDDHDLSRQFTVQALRQITRRVKQAATGREALRLASLLRPELIFLDLHLADTDGFTLLKKIKSGWPVEVPQPGFVVLTGDSPAVTRRAFKWPAGITILTKPARRRDIRELAIHRLPGFRGVRDGKPEVETGAPLPVLHEIFLRDLETQGPLLDQHISALDWQSARGLLHQMLAATAMCHEAEIERYCRLLSDEMAESCRPEPIAQAYFGLLRAIEHARNGHHT